MKDKAIEQTKRHVQFVQKKTLIEIYAKIKNLYERQYSVKLVGFQESM